MADIQQLMQLGQQVQGRWQDIQRDLASRTVDATAGGGMVRVTVDGRGQLRGVWIDPSGLPHGEDVVGLGFPAGRAEQTTGEAGGGMNLKMEPRC